MKTNSTNMGAIIAVLEGMVYPEFMLLSSFIIFRSYHLTHPVLIHSGNNVNLEACLSKKRLMLFKFFD
jgi:hypothetical protein